MELRALLRVFTQHRALFLSILFLPLFLAMVGVFFLLPQKYDAAMTLTLLRANGNNAITENTEQIDQKDEYDSFYRLGADEKMSDTIAELISSPAVVASIFAEGTQTPSPDQFDTKDLKDFFSVKKESPHVIEITFQTDAPQVARSLKAPLVQKLNDHLGKIGESYDKNQSFSILASEPLVRKHVYNYALILIASLVVGFSGAVLLTLLRHYLTEQE